MALTLRSKTAVKFEFTDGEVESSVTLNPDDDEAMLVRKLTRIVSMAGVWISAADRPRDIDPGVRPMPPALTPPALTADQIGNGWEMLTKEGK